VKVRVRGSRAARRCARRRRQEGSAVRLVRVEVRVRARARVQARASARVQGRVGAWARARLGLRVGSGLALGVRFQGVQPTERVRVRHRHTLWLLGAKLGHGVRQLLALCERGVGAGRATWLGLLVRVRVLVLGLGLGLGLGFRVRV